MNRFLRRIFIGIMLFSILVMPAFAYRYAVPRVAGTTGTITYTQGRDENIRVKCGAGDVGELVIVGQGINGAASYEALAYTATASYSVYKYSNITALNLTNTSTADVTISSTTEGVICTIEAGSKGRHMAFLLNNATYNLPSNNVITTDAIDTERDIDTASKTIYLKCSDITTATAVKYQVSDDASNWIDGLVSLISLDNNSKRYVIADKNAKYIRLVFTNTTTTNETPATVKGYVIF